MSVEVNPGVFKNKQIEEIKAWFDEHELDTEKFFKMYERELTKRGWTVEKINERVRETAQFGLDYHEVKPPTIEERKKAADILMSQAQSLLKQAKELRPHEDIPTFSEEVEKAIETPIEKTKEVKQKVNRIEFKCKKCGYVAKNAAGLSIHLSKTHLEDLGQTKTIL